MDLEELLVNEGGSFLDIIYPLSDEEVDEEYIRQRRDLLGGKFFVNL